MRYALRRLAALMLVLTLAVSALFAAAAEDDWRKQLLEAYGDVLEDYEAEEEAEEQTEVEFELPVTDPQQIVNYLARYGELPENFITKKEAQALGWNRNYNYLGDVAPGKSIGGDRFGNYEGSLPSKKGRVWYECDANYRGSGRGPERVLYSSDGLYYYSDDHYKTFTRMYPEE